MDFELRKEYDQLAAKELKFPLIDDVKKFKEKCITIANNEYAYKADLLIADVYLEHSSYEEPLRLLLNTINQIDATVYPNIYLETVERILFIYITKKNYRLALMYSSIKEKFINNENLSEVNRSLLEKSYIYAQMDENDKAIACLEQIINNPTPECLKYALNNITSLYIDKKNIALAEQSLNKCLALTDDEEGRVYCDYLLAKICILKGNFNDALVLLKQIFENEDINQMTLPMVNDYLELLYNQNKFDEMALAISKIALFINACDDLTIQKQFVKNKIKYLVATKNVSQLQEIINEYETIDKKINDNEKKIAMEINEHENDENVHKAVETVTNNLDTMIAVFNNNSTYSSVRDLIMSFGKNLQKCVLFDELSFVQIGKPITNTLLPSKDINLYRYNNGRLYEKLLQEGSLEGSLASLVINQNKPLCFDLIKNKLDIINLFTSRKYSDDSLNYVYAVPVVYQANIFGVMIFASSNNDLTERNTSVLFDFASKIFESNIITYFTRDLLALNETICNTTLLDSNTGLMKYNDDDMYISDTLVNVFKQKSNYIKRRSYLYYVSKNDIDRYKRAIEADDYKISYKLNIGSLFVSVIENANTYKDEAGNKLFKYGTISVEQGSIKTLIDGKQLLNNKLRELSFDKADNYNLKFAFIRLRTIPSDYELIRKTFGTTPYFLSDSDCVVVYEKDASIQALSDACTTITDAYSIIRFPRDVEEIDELLTRSELMMNHQVQIYDKEVYAEFLREETANKIAGNAFMNLGNKAQLAVTRYNSYDDEIWIAPSLYYEDENLQNNLDENIKELLSEDNRIKYDIKLFRTIIDNNIKVNTILFVSSKALKKIYERGLLNENSERINFVISDNNVSDLNDLIQNVSQNANVIVDGKILKYVSIYNFDKKYVKGLYLSKGIEYEDREQLVKIASLFKLEIVSNVKMNDWNKNIFATKDVKVI